MGQREGLHLFVTCSCWWLPRGRQGLLGWLWVGEHCCLALTLHAQLCVPHLGIWEYH